MSKKTAFDIYNEYLTASQVGSKQIEKNAAQSTLRNELKNSASFHSDATINGVQKDILATRKSATKCSITTFDDLIAVGDLVTVFGEYWLCMSSYKDELDVNQGELWLCNHTLKFQNGTSEIIERHAIIDDGTYSSISDKSIMTPSGKYICYVGIDEDTKHLFIDKRIAIGKIFNKNNEEILDVFNISGIDYKSLNVGSGSHLMTIRFDAGEYSAEKDSIEAMICDYIQTEEDSINIPSFDASISGKDSIRIGSSRTYDAILSEQMDIKWTVDNLPNDGKVSSTLNSCVVKIPLDYEAVGSFLTIKCIADNDVVIATKTVEVVDNG